jgi:hypothetical protein
MTVAPFSAAWADQAVVFPAPLRLAFIYVSEV